MTTSDVLKPLGEADTAEYCLKTRMKRCCNVYCISRSCTVCKKTTKMIIFFLQTWCRLYNPYPLKEKELLYLTWGESIDRIISDCPITAVLFFSNKRVLFLFKNAILLFTHLSSSSEALVLFKINVHYLLMNNDIMSRDMTDKQLERHSNRGCTGQSAAD